MGVGQSCLGEMATSYLNTPCLLVIPFAMTPWDKETQQLPATIERHQVMFHINLFYGLRPRIKLRGEKMTSRTHGHGSRTLGPDAGTLEAFLSVFAL